MHACRCARNRRQETNVLIVSVLFAVVVNLALRSISQGCIEVVGMRKLTIVVGLGAFPVTIKKILFRYGDLTGLSPGGGGRCGRGRGMGGQDGLRAGADAR